MDGWICFGTGKVVSERGDGAKTERGCVGVWDHTLDANLYSVCAYPGITLNRYKMHNTYNTYN